MVTALSDKPELDFCRTTRYLAVEARGQFPLGSQSWGQAFRRSRRPVDYMRLAEFTSAYDQISLSPGMKVLDVSSPQWFSICLAKMFPAVCFTYINVLPSELACVSDFPSACQLGNIDYQQMDVRSLRFSCGTFDRVISLSVLEHIEPADGGDKLALSEIRRVLKQDGRVTLSVPIKKVRRTVCSSLGCHTIFSAREYDSGQFETLIGDSGYSIEKIDFIEEPPSLLALDRLEWSGKYPTVGPLLCRLLRGVEIMTGIYIEGFLAKRGLKVRTFVGDYCANAVCTLRLENGYSN